MLLRPGLERNEYLNQRHYKDHKGSDRHWAATSTSIGSRGHYSTSKVNGAFKGKR